MHTSTIIRPGESRDLDAVAAIQRESLEAVQWEPADYLQYNLRIAVTDGVIAGFLAARTLAPGEHEILNLAVRSGLRRHGIGRALIEDLFKRHSGEVYLEVRESNAAARNLYKSLGFQEVGVRAEYYQFPSESAIVMKFHSC